MFGPAHRHNPLQDALAVFLSLTPPISVTYMPQHFIAGNVFLVGQTHPQSLMPVLRQQLEIDPIKDSIGQLEAMMQTMLTHRDEAAVTLRVVRRHAPPGGTTRVERIMRRRFKFRILADSTG